MNHTSEQTINLGVALRRIFEIAEWLDSRAVVLKKDDKETLPKLRHELAVLKARLAPGPDESVKCDGDHGMPRCNAKAGQCWQDDPAPEEPVSKFKCGHCGDTKWVQGEPCEWCAPEKPASKCDHNPNGYCADCWPAFKKPSEAQCCPQKEQVIDYCRNWARSNCNDDSKETFYARLGLLLDFATDLYRDQIRPQNQAQNDSESPSGANTPNNPSK